MNKNTQIALNMAASVVAFAVSLGINFFLSPYIIKSVGVEAYGFVSLANNFVSYASILTLALNSMAGRFITIALYQGNLGKANIYFNSVMLANVFLAGLMLIPSVFITLYIDKIVNVPQQILPDIKILFALLFLNFLVSILTSTLGVAFFATNKLYIRSKISIEAQLMKAVLICILFVLFKPAVSFLGLTALIALLYGAFFDFYYKNKLLPELKYNHKSFDLSAIKELVSAGIWNVVTRLGTLLLEGMDLLIANLFIDAQAMGILAIAKTIPNMIQNIIGTLINVFMPNFTIVYAKGDMKELVRLLKQSMKIMGLIINIPVAILVAFGDIFFSLWVPTQDAKLLQILSVITILAVAIVGPVSMIHNIFTVVNKLKVNSILLICSGILNCIIVFALLNTTNLGLFAIAGVSTLFNILRNTTFTAIYGAKCLNCKWYTFYPEIIKTTISFFVVCCMGFIIKSQFFASTWIGFFVLSGISSVIGFVFNFLFLLNKIDRAYLFATIKSILRRK